MRSDPTHRQIAQRGRTTARPDTAPRVGIAAEVVVVVPPLEVLVGADHPVDLLTHVGLEDLGGDGGVVGHGDGLADVVAKRCDDNLAVGARPRSARVAVCRQCVS